MTGECVLVKSTPSFCVKPFASKRSLYFWIAPFGLYLTLLIHLFQTSLQCIGFGTKSHILFSMIEWYSRSIASFYEAKSVEESALSYDCGLSMYAPKDARSASDSAVEVINWEELQDDMVASNEVGVVVEVRIRSVVSMISCED